MILPVVFAYVLGLLLGPYLAFFPCSLLSWLLFIAVLLTYCETRRVLSRASGVLLFAVLVIGVGQGHWAATAHQQAERIPSIHEQPVTIVGDIIAPVRHTPEGVVFVVEPRFWTAHDKTLRGSGRIRVSWREPGETPSFGNQVQFTGILRTPYGTHNPGGFDYGRYLQQQGIDAVTTLRGVGAVSFGPSPKLSWRAWVLGPVDHWRKTVHDAAVASLASPALGVFLGMVLGEQSFIEPEVRDAFMASGTVHILSISGSHLGLLAVLIFTVVRGCFCLLPSTWIERMAVRLTATRCAMLVTLPAVSFYALLAGAEMATVRSWIMIVVFGIGVWLGHTKNLATALAVAALLILIPHPEAVYDISFQLSFVSVAAIAMVVWSQRMEDDVQIKQEIPSRTRISSRLYTLWQNTKMAWGMSLAVSVATLPLVAFYFHQIPWLGIMTNLVIVPLVGILVIPLGLFSGIAGLIMGMEIIPFAGLNQSLFNALAYSMAWIARMPGAEWYVASPAIPAMLVFGLTLGGVYVWKNRWILRWSGIGILVGLLCWWGWSPRSGWEPGEVRVTFLDVGQGDATLIELPDGRTVLIDGGPAYPRLDMGRAVIGPILWNKGIRRLDHVIATHPQWDHVGGLPWILRTFSVGNYWSNGVIREEAFFQRLQSVIEQRGIPISIAEEGQELLHSGPCSLKVLNPPATASASQMNAPDRLGGTWLNNRSVISRLTCGVHAFLFMADAEHEALERMAQRADGIAAEIVKIPHHGAKSSLTSRWVDQLNATAFVVSVGAHNRYGHPAAEVMEAYRQKHRPIFQTDRDGAVWFVGTSLSPHLSTHTTREMALIPVKVGGDMLREEYLNWTRLLM